MEDCIFCKIIKGDIPCAKLYEDQNVLAFLDIGPISEGHSLIVPKKHQETLLDIPNEEILPVFSAVKKVAQAQQKALGNEGFNILMNNKQVAGQVVPHAHIHIIPRDEGDGLFKEWSSKEYEPGKMEEVLEKMKKVL